MNPARNLDCIMLHGWGVDYRVWNDFSSRFGGFDSVLTPCLYELSITAADNSLLSVAKSLGKGIQKKCVVIAWSLGGAVALYLSGICDQIKAIIFIASVPCFINKTGWHNVIAEKDLMSLQNHFLAEPESTLARFSSLIAGGDDTPVNTVKYLRRCLPGKERFQLLSKWLNELTDLDLRKEFMSLPVPAQVLLGEHDVLINRNIRRQLTELNGNIRVSVIEHCGHSPFISEEHETGRKIEQYLDAALQ